jgi:tetratricopeptide (TPR) repeat protein
LASEPAKALPLFEKAMQQSPDGGAAGFFVALLADDLKKRDVRDHALEVLIAANQPRSELARLLLETLAHGKSLDLQAVEQALKKLKSAVANHYCYFVGRVLEKGGRRPEALAYFNRLATATEALDLYRTLAAAALRQEGVQPGKIKPAH